MSASSPLSFSQCYPTAWFVSTLDEEFLCSACHGVLRNPVQLPCGHCCGRDCLSQCCRHDGGGSRRILCPVPTCGFELPQEVELTAVEVAALSRLVAKAIVRCDRCGEWEGSLQSFVTKAHDCPLEILPCPFHCGLQLERRAIAQHRSECGRRSAACGHCLKQFPYQDLPLHDARCQEKVVECNLACGQSVRRRDMTQHVDTACPNVLVSCPFHSFGCSDGGSLRRGDVERHVEASLGKHCTLLVDLIKAERAESARQVAALQKRIQELESLVEGNATVRGVSLSDVVTAVQEQVWEQQRLVDAACNGKQLVVGPCGGFDTIRAALDSYTPGDVVVLRPGTYAEVVELTEKHRGITLRGTSSDTVFLRGHIVFRCDAALSQLSVVNQEDRNSVALRVVQGHVVVSNVYATSANLSVCQVDGGTAELVGCTLEGTSQHGLRWRSSECGVVRDCRIFHCSQSSVVVERGKLTLVDCDVHSGAGNALSVRAEGSCTAVSTALRDHKCSNVEAQGHVELERCSVFRSEKCGSFVSGNLQSRETKIFENKLPNVFIAKGGVVQMQRSKVLAGLQQGIVVKAGGVLQLGEQCMVSGNCLDNVVAEEGAVVDL